MRVRVGVDEKLDVGDVDGVSSGDSAGWPAVPCAYSVVSVHVESPRRPHGTILSTRTPRRDRAGVIIFPTACCPERRRRTSTLRVGLCASSSSHLAPARAPRSSTPCSWKANSGAGWRGFLTRAWTWASGRADRLDWAGGLGWWSPRGSRRSVPVRGADDGAARDGDESSTSLERDTETRAVSRARLSRRPRDAHQTLRTFEPCVRRAEESRDARARPSPGLRQNLCARRGSRRPRAMDFTSAGGASSG